MYEAYVTYVDDEYVDNHDYDDDTDDDTWWSVSYTHLTLPTTMLV